MAEQQEERQEGHFSPYMDGSVAEQDEAAVLLNVVSGDTDAVDATWSGGVTEEERSVLVPALDDYGICWENVGGKRSFYCLYRAN